MIEDWQQSIDRLLKLPNVRYLRLFLTDQSSADDVKAVLQRCSEAGVKVVLVPDVLAPCEDWIMLADQHEAVAYLQLGDQPFRSRSGRKVEFDSLLKMAMEKTSKQFIISLDGAFVAEIFRNHRRQLLQGNTFRSLLFSYVSQLKDDRMRARLKAVCLELPAQHESWPEWKIARDMLRSVEISSLVCAQADSVNSFESYFERVVSIRGAIVFIAGAQTWDDSWFKAAESVLQTYGK